jgi:hypothetical protein
MRKVYVKRDPFKALLPGEWFAADIVTFDVRSRHGHRYCMVTRDMATGWYFPLIWLERRSDVTSQFEAQLVRLRKSGLFKRL